MTEPARKKKRKEGSPYREPPAPAPPPAEDAEITAAKWLAIGLPVGCVLLALATGIVMSAAPSILVLVSGAILGTVLLLWSSVRTLTGDAPVDDRLAAAAAEARQSETLERKRRALLALKDLESERSLGKLDDEDYAILSAQYRAQAKEVMREIDAEIDPLRAKAEAFIEKHHGGERAAPDPARACPSCSTENDEDATFCKKCGVKLDAA